MNGEAFALSTSLFYFFLHLLPSSPNRPIPNKSVICEKVRKVIITLIVDATKKKKTKEKNSSKPKSPQKMVPKTRQSVFLFPPFLGTLPREGFVSQVTFFFFVSIDISRHPFLGEAIALCYSPFFFSSSLGSKGKCIPSGGRLSLSLPVFLATKKKKNGFFPDTAKRRSQSTPTAPPQKKKKNTQISHTDFLSFLSPTHTPHPHPKIFFKIIQNKEQKESH